MSFLLDSPVPLVFAGPGMEEALLAVHAQHCGHDNLPTDNEDRGNSKNVFDPAMKGYNVYERPLWVQFCTSCPRYSQIDAIVIAEPHEIKETSERLRLLQNVKHVDIDYPVLRQDGSFAGAVESTFGNKYAGYFKSEKFKAFYLTMEFARMFGGWSAQAVHASDCIDMYLLTEDTPKGIRSFSRSDKKKLTMSQFHKWLDKAVM